MAAATAIRPFRPGPPLRKLRNSTDFSLFGITCSCAYDHFEEDYSSDRIELPRERIALPPSRPRPGHIENGEALPLDARSAGKLRSSSGYSLRDAATPASPSSKRAARGEAWDAEVSTEPPSDDAAAGVSVAAALIDGRLLEADRQLRRLGIACDADAGSPFGSVERVQRIAAAYALQAGGDGQGSGGSWQHERDGDLEFSYLLDEDGCLEIRTTIQSACDAAQAAAAICEVDLQKGYRPNLLSASTIGAEEPTDAAWHVVTKGRITGGIEDVVLQVSAVDALDEEKSCIWVLMRTPEEEDACTELLGAPVPPPDSGVTRLAYTVTTLCAAPTRGGSILTLGIRVRPSAAAAFAISAMPTFMLRKLIRSRAKEGITKFRDHAEQSVALEERMTSSPRAPFYAATRRRLAGEAPPRGLRAAAGSGSGASAASTGTPGGEASSSDTTASTAASAGPRRSSAAASAAANAPWSEVAALLAIPAGWADDAG